MDPTASIYEVTRLILARPELGAGQVAAAHGYTAAEVAEALPYFLDTLRTDFAWAGSRLDALHFGPPQPAPGEGPEHLAERWLAEVGRSVAVAGGGPGTTHADPTHLDHEAVADGPAGPPGADPTGESAPAGGLGDFGLGHAPHGPGGTPGVADGPGDARAVDAGFGHGGLTGTGDEPEVDDHAPGVGDDPAAALHDLPGADPQPDLDFGHGV